ncbi:MAG TPA: DMT family transporter [Baekduia sp.]|nr:DMT family transporter [Baekduia sp.]
MLAITLAVSAAVLWGVADFLAGLASRRIAVPLVLLLVQAGGLVVIGAVTLATGEPLPDSDTILLALAAGACGVTALGLFYRALAIGTMSVVAPVAATGVALPVIVGVATGERPGPAVTAGLAAAVVGIVLASREEHADAAAARVGRTSLLLALGAAAGFGVFFVAFDAAADGSELWTLTLLRAVAIPLVGAVVLARRPAAPPRPLALQVAGVGVIDMSATACLALAATRGDLSVVSVLGSMYPVMTVLLAALVLRERLSRLQGAGVALALVGVGLVAAG